MMCQCQDFAACQCQSRTRAHSVQLSPAAARLDSGVGIQAPDPVTVLSSSMLFKFLRFSRCRGQASRLLAAAAGTGLWHSTLGPAGISESDGGPAGWAGASVALTVTGSQIWSLPAWVRPANLAEKPEDWLVWKWNFIQSPSLLVLAIGLSVLIMQLNLYILNRPIILIILIIWTFVGWFRSLFHIKIFHVQKSVHLKCLWIKWL